MSNIKGQSIGQAAGFADKTGLFLNAEQKKRKEQALANVSLQTKHATVSGHEESGWNQVQMAAVAPVGPVEGAVDGGGEVLVTSWSDSGAYAEAFAQSMDESLNDPEFIDRLNECLGAEARPYRTEPTPIALPLLADNSVKFNPTSRYADSDKPKTTVKFGSMVSVEKAQSAVMFNHSVRMFDIHMDSAGMTQHSMQAMVEQALVDVCASMANHAADILSAGGLTEKVEVAKPSGKPSEVAEDILDLLAMNMKTAYGASIAEFTLMIPQSMEPILDRAAQRAGVEDSEELLGCAIMTYAGADRGIFMIPRRFTSLSFRTASTGDVFPVTMSRDAGRAAWVIEMRGVVDIVADATAVDADGVEVKLPVITQLVWKAEEETKK
ncbi:hypothetical protein JK211_08405 [Tatumella sp. JGM130]|uniref:hypothetical protein n=1 Tax=Tatumella sp. JGM130 TaxID=2799797 RepID=UPI001BAF857A|nr:hypothetical protein [Tatumella sp. JGM130]MBS0894054.1 hypothetical protein [Tatumella sp. JGM130]